MRFNGRIRLMVRAIQLTARIFDIAQSNVDHLVCQEITSQAYGQAKCLFVAIAQH